MKRVCRITFASTLFACCFADVPAYGERVPSEHESSHIRRPVSAVLCDQGRLLCVVNRRSGSVSLIDADERQVIGESVIGEHLSDVAVLPDGRTVLITDEARNELFVVRPSRSGIEVVSRVETPRSPVDVAVSEDGRLVSVAGLWSHRVALFDVSKDGTVSHFATVRLPFAARKQTFVGAESPVLVVADAFGGGLVVVAPTQARGQSGRSCERERGRQGEHAVPLSPSPLVSPSLDEVGGSLIVSSQHLPGHNIRGLAVSHDGERLIIAHQTLSSLARADYNDVIWGHLMQNFVRELPVASLLKPEKEWLDDSRGIRLGEAGDGAADPGGVAVWSPSIEVVGRDPGVGDKGTRRGGDGDVPRVSSPSHLVTLSGVDELVVHNSQTSSRVEVGAHPVDVVWDAERLVAYVICSLDDSVVVVDPKAAEVVARIDLGPQPVETPRERGERLFYDGHQSLDGWLSCHSCHPDGHTNHGLADTFADGTFGSPKQVPSLLGVRDANPWGWNGSFRELHEQVRSSFVATMRGEGVDAGELNDVVAFLHTLEPPPPVDEGIWTQDDLAQIEQGRHLFGEIGCKRCHVPPLTYTLDTTFDVGLQDEAGLKTYNPPTLRGVSQRHQFLHDGRATSLDDVFVSHGHQLETQLSPDELVSLLAFLGSL